MRNPLISFLAVTGFFLYGITPNRSLPVPAAANSFSTIHTRAGLISGAVTSDGVVHSFKGIPFAAPPVGPNRWRAPQPLAPWKGIRKCDSFGPSPAQMPPRPFGVYTAEFLIPEKPISEDCLYLNVWTAAKTPREHRPVLVFIYGGGFSSGGSGCAIYDGEAMARKGVVFVTVNYRVGIFGFFSHPALTAESGHNASGNYGLMDQIAALQWVKENIAAFGGDPSNVTIAGQSAGAMSVSCLVASPLAKDLFRRAIGESGASIVTAFFLNPTLQQAEQNGLKTAARLRAADIAALRALPAAQLLTVTGQRGPIIDGYVLPEPPGDIFRAHRNKRCDLLTGWNDDDWFLGAPPTATQFRQEIEQQFGAGADSALQFYPATDDATALTSQEHLNRDMVFAIQNYTWANLQSQDDQHPVYLYRFRRRPPASGDFIKYGAFHTAEVPYAYNNLSFVNRPWQPVDRQLAETMSSYWANFARTGNPNGPGLPAWPAYRQPDGATLILDEQPHAAPMPDKAALDFILPRITAK
ncbi:MAG TPA: carboxylesterase family protein [Puia sp.]|nr:carboxylesterase family protein [Puia sp.]